VKCLIREGYRTAICLEGGCSDNAAAFSRRAQLPRKTISSLVAIVVGVVDIYTVRLLLLELFRGWHLGGITRSGIKWRSAHPVLLSPLEVDEIRGGVIRCDMW
jgi:hypothetical protein